MWLNLSERDVLAVLEVTNMKGKNKHDNVKAVQACNSKQLLHMLVCNCLLIRHISVQKQLLM